MNRQPFRNWGDHPLIVILGAFAALASIATTVKYFEDSSEKTKKPTSSSVDSLDPTKKLRIRIACEESTTTSKWRWKCSLQNASSPPSLILWRDTFALPGGKFNWSCRVLTFNIPEENSDRCITESEDLEFNANGSVRFVFLREGEKLDFTIACPSRPYYCEINGRTQNVAVTGVKIDVLQGLEEYLERNKK